MSPTCCRHVANVVSCRQNSGRHSFLHIRTENDAAGSVSSAARDKNPWFSMPKNNPVSYNLKWPLRRHYNDAQTAAIHIGWSRYGAIKGNDQEVHGGATKARKDRMPPPKETFGEPSILMPSSLLSLLWAAALAVVFSMAQYFHIRFYLGWHVCHSPLTIHVNQWCSNE